MSIREWHISLTLWSNPRTSDQSIEFRPTSPEFFCHPRPYHESKTKNIPNSKKNSTQQTDRPHHPHHHNTSVTDGPTQCCGHFNLAVFNIFSIFKSQRLGPSVPVVNNIVA